MKSLLLIPVLLTLTSCVVVPKTHIKGMIANQPIDIETPKDSTIVGLDISVETNGTVHVKIDSLTARMNPDVITMSGEAQVKLMNAAGNIAAQGVAAGVQAAK